MAGGLTGLRRLEHAPRKFLLPVHDLAGAEAAEVPHAFRRMRPRDDWQVGAQRARGTHDLPAFDRVGHSDDQRAGAQEVGFAEDGRGRGNYLKNYNDSEHAVKTKSALFFMNFSNI